VREHVTAILPFQVLEKIVEKTGLEIRLLKDGAHGGDMEIGAMIANKKLDYLIFFWDPLESLPHDVDVKALLRIAVLYNVPTACNRATADLIISSPMFNIQSQNISQDGNFLFLVL
jgi:methylglyoxal synthase